MRCKSQYSDAGFNILAMISTKWHTNAITSYFQGLKDQLYIFIDK